jgi:hypothetical protein
LVRLGAILYAQAFNILADVTIYSIKETIYA